MRERAAVGNRAASWAVARVDAVYAVGIVCAVGTVGTMPGFQY